MPPQRRRRRSSRRSTPEVRNFFALDSPTLARAALAAYMTDQSVIDVEMAVARPRARRHAAPRIAAKEQTKAGRRARRVPPEARRQAILEAALTEFAERGFAAARLDDVAARAGVAKGTLYLYFEHKEALFEQLVHSAVSPVMDQFGKIAEAADLSPITALEAFFTLFQKEVLGTDRKLLLRLIIAEGARFPALAEIYYREVITRGLRLMRRLAEGARKQGAFATDATVRYPQLIVAPLILAVIWDSLFSRVHPLDVGGLLRAHREVLISKAQKAIS
jgi:AcrR family transcriptional regulator